MRGKQLGEGRPYKRIRRVFAAGHPELPARLLAHPFEIGELRVKLGDIGRKGGQQLLARCGRGQAAR